MRAILAGALAFFTVPTLLGFGITLHVLHGRTAFNAHDADDFAMAAWLILVATGLATLGFLLPIATARSWRSLPSRHAFVIASVLSVAFPIAYFTGIGIAGGFLLPLLRSVPWLGTGAAFFLPGFALGLLAVAVAALVQRHACNPSDPTAL